MNCNRCGAPLPDGAAFCPNCATPSSFDGPPRGAYAPPGGYAPPSGYGPPPNIPDYLVWSILTTLCCQPFGIAALVFSIMTMNDKTNGRFDSAVKNSKMAKTMVTIGLIGWALLVLFYLGIIVVMVVLEQGGAG